MDFKDQWDLDTALKIVRNKGVGSELWAEAVEWLLLFGPPEVVSILLQASGHATEQVFPELKAASHTSDGTPIYDISNLVKTLGIPEKEIRKIIEDKHLAGGKTPFFFQSGSETVH